MMHGIRNVTPIVFFLILVFSGAAVAQTADADYDYVVKVQASKDKHLYVAVNGNFAAAHGCPNLAWAKSQYDLSDPQTQAMSQIALSSLLARASVHVYTEGCDGDFPRLVQIQIQERPSATTPATPATPPSGRTCTPASGERCCGFMANGRCRGQCAKICP